MKNKAVLEGLLFVVGEEGLSIDQIEDVLEINEEEAKQVLRDLKHSYEQEDRGLRIDFLGNKFKLTTKFEHKEYYQKLIENPETNTLRQAALETLAIVAYNEPLTRVEVDEIRGVGSSHIIRKLVAKALIKEVGREDTPGKPILYGVTDEFMDAFSLTSLNELPELKEIKDDFDQEDIFNTKYTEKE